MPLTAREINLLNGLRIGHLCCQHRIAQTLMASVEELLQQRLVARDGADRGCAERGIAKICIGDHHARRVQVIHRRGPDLTR